jgi:hypothetical protein
MRTNPRHLKRAGISRATVPEYPKTPTLEKMKSVKDKSQAIGEFLDVFLAEKGVQLGAPHIHNKNCLGWDERRNRYNPGPHGRCSWYSGQFEPFHYTVEKLLAEFFGIDLNKAEEEKRALLEHLQYNMKRLQKMRSNRG